MHNEEGDDLIVSFAIEDEPGEVKSLILLRSPKYEFALDDHERGVNVSHEDQPDLEEHDLLRKFTVGAGIVAIETTHTRYELDVSRVDREELKEAVTILRRMNFDKRFALEITK